MMRILFTLVALAASTSPAHADPITIGAFFAGIGSTFGIAAPIATTAAAIGAFNAGAAFIGFLASPIGGLLLSLGGAAVSAAFGGGAQQRATPPDASRVNVRIEKAPRWLHAGETVRAGGAVLFGEYDASGRFWYLIVHGDSELLATTHYMFDDRVLTMVGNEIDTDEFCLTAEYDQYEGSGTKVRYFSIWTTTYSLADPVPPPIAAFKAAFPEWTDNHKLAGTTFSVVRINAIPQQHRHKLFRWRGPFQLGEPALSIVGAFARIYDPRDPAHDIADPATWGPSSNPVLISAWWRTHPYGLGRSVEEVNWTQVADEADKCDLPITDKYGDTAPCYACHVAVPDDMPRGQGEQLILDTCDGVRMFDEEGKFYPKVGAWEEPSLTLSADRDIFAMSSRAAEDGESETDGVVVEYTEPEFGYISQPAAPWINPTYFVPGREPSYLRKAIPACQNHNQAIRLAKAMGHRSQPPYKLQPVTGLRALLARQKRIASLDYDAEFTGPQEIVTPVEVDEAGVAGAFGLVPVDADRWRLLPGEEGDKPQSQSAGQDQAPALPTGVLVFATEVPGSGGSAVRLEAMFDAAPRVDHRYEFEYRKLGGTTWLPFRVLMEDRFAYSETVEDSAVYEVRWSTVSTSGRRSAYIDPVVQVTAVADTTPPGPVAFTGPVDVSVAGEATIPFTAPNSPNYRATLVYLNTVDDFATAAIEGQPEYGAANSSDAATRTLAAGTYFAWLVAINGSGVEAPPVPTGSFTVF